MVDGTGMCGACRVAVDGVMKFACVEGPEFDGHLVDFDSAIARQRQFADNTENYLDLKKKDHDCNIDIAIAKQHKEILHDLEKSLNGEGNKSIDEIAKMKNLIDLQELLSQIKTLKSEVKTLKKFVLDIQKKAVIEAKRCLNCKNLYALADVLYQLIFQVL